MNGSSFPTQRVPWDRALARATEELMRDGCIGTSGQYRLRTLTLKAMLADDARELQEFYSSAVDIIDAALHPTSLPTE